MELKEALENDEKFVDYMMESMELFQKVDMVILIKNEKGKGSNPTHPDQMTSCSKHPYQRSLRLPCLMY